MILRAAFLVSAAIALLLPGHAAWAQDRAATLADIRQNLTTTATLGASYRDYVGTGGHDLTLSGQVGLTWWLNRNVGFTGRARYERVTSNLPGRTTNTTSVYAGVTLRR